MATAPRGYGLTSRRAKLRLGSGENARRSGGAKGDLGRSRTLARRRGRGEAMAGRRRRGQATAGVAMPRRARACPQAPVYGRTHGGRQARPWRARGGGTGQGEWPPRRRHGTPTGRISEGPTKASKGVTLVAWLWLCAHSRSSGSPEPRRGRTWHDSARGTGVRRRRLRAMAAKRRGFLQAHKQGNEAPRASLPTAQWRPKHAGAGVWSGEANGAHLAGPVKKGSARCRFGAGGSRQCRAVRLR